MTETHCAAAAGPRVAVVGPGGIGAFFGAQLSALGLDVLYCGRRPFAKLAGADPPGRPA